MEFLLLILVLVATEAQGLIRHDNCYHYEDVAAKYKLHHDASRYPTNEINLVLERYPYMKNMFYKDEHTYASHPTPYATPMASVCPHEKFTLYSFFYGTKNCYVVYPDVQQISYIRCSTAHNRDCQQCGYGAPAGSVSKCVEDYQYRYVWAYCKLIKPPTTTTHRPIRTTPKPTPKPVDHHHHPHSHDGGQTHSHDHNHDYGHEDKQPTSLFQPPYGVGDSSVSSRTFDPFSIIEHPVNFPKPSTGLFESLPMFRHYRDHRNMMYKPMMRSSRWKRYAHRGSQEGKIERMALYLPYHCGCMTFTC